MRASRRARRPITVASIVVAEGDSVVARFTVAVTQSGQKTTAVGLAYYRVVNGKITIDEPLASPDLGQLLAPFLAQLAHA